MTEEECKAFVVKAVSHAMARDGSSGGCIRTVTINKDGVFRWAQGQWQGRLADGEGGQFSGGEGV